MLIALLEAASIQHHQLPLIPASCRAALPPTPPPPSPHNAQLTLSFLGQRTAIFLVLFALIMLLIIYSSNSGNEVFHYTALRGKSHRPPNFRKWGVKSGYLPIYGNKTLNSHCHQCVIITSSSHLLGSKLGSEIDQSECVIRMNDAPTTGYEADMGNKTTIRVVAHSSVYRVLKRPQEFVNKTPETILIFWGPPSKMQKSLLKILQRVSMSFPNVSAYVVSPGRMKQFDDLFRGETGKDRGGRDWAGSSDLACSPKGQGVLLHTGHCWIHGVPFPPTGHTPSAHHWFPALRSPHSLAGDQLRGPRVSGNNRWVPRWNG
uniref:ST6 N-acetylgalactosaminide alpha-2,6-sialyltransferase 6 n=1 Tax=Chelonoidis abingdonii TaxID=106734 RepID=A0A8C0IJV6_CHEAB